jgi:hypothetical protein
MENPLVQKSIEIAKEITAYHTSGYNRVLQTLLNTHLLIQMNRMGEGGPHAPMLEALPDMELTMSPYWQKEDLIEVDSFNVINEHRNATHLQTYMAKQFQDFEFTRYGSDEFMWAFHIAGSRFTVLENTEEKWLKDPDYHHFICPLAEYINHSFEPN